MLASVALCSNCVVDMQRNLCDVKKQINDMPRKTQIDGTINGCM